jgi:hypothetical protein
MGGENRFAVMFAPSQAAFFTQFRREAQDKAGEPTRDGARSR